MNVDHAVMNVDHAVMNVDHAVIGAQLGRPNTISDPNSPIKFRLSLLKMDGDYDMYGFYWGRSTTGLMFHAFGTSNDMSKKEKDNEMYIRARTRKDAKEQVLLVYKNAIFFN